MEIEILRKVPIFSDLKDEELRSVMSMTAQRSYLKNTVILWEEEQGDVLYIIESGTVKIARLNEDGREVILAILGPLEFFGEIALLDGKGRTANVTAIEDSVVLALKHRDFINVLERFPSIAIQLLRELAARQRKSDEQIKALSLLKVEHRIGVILKRIAEETGDSNKRQMIISQLPYQQDIASMAGTTRETVSRIFKELEARSLIAREGRRLVINDYGTFCRLYG